MGSSIKSIINEIRPVLLPLGFFIVLFGVAFYDPMHHDETGKPLEQVTTPSLTTEEYRTLNEFAKQLLFPDTYKDSATPTEDDIRLMRITGSYFVHIFVQHCLEGTDPATLFDKRINIQEHFSGGTMLHAACEEGNLEKAQFLVLHGADATIEDEYGLTPRRSALSLAQVIRNYKKKTELLRIADWLETKEEPIQP